MFWKTSQPPPVWLEACHVPFSDHDAWADGAPGVAQLNSGPETQEARRRIHLTVQLNSDSRISSTISAAVILHDSVAILNFAQVAAPVSGGSFYQQFGGWRLVR